jgi:hypothetical protein
MARRYPTPYDEDDLDISRRRPYHPPTRAGLHSLLLALGTFALLGLIAILWVVANEVGNMDGSGLIVVFILVINLAAFVASLISVFLGFRAQHPDNTQYRGCGVAGLVCGILGLLASVAVGLVSFCVGLLLGVMNNIPGG